jgi:hypothetical protein
MHDLLIFMLDLIIYKSVVQFANLIDLASIVLGLAQHICVTNYSTDVHAYWDSNNAK